MIIYKTQLERNGFSIFDPRQLKDLYKSHTNDFKYAEEEAVKAAIKGMNVKGTKVCSHFIVKGTLHARVVISNGIVIKAETLKNFQTPLFSKSLESYLKETPDTSMSLIIFSEVKIQIHMKHAVYSLVPDPESILTKKKKPVKIEKSWKLIGKREKSISEITNKPQSSKDISKPKKTSRKSKK